MRVLHVIGNLAAESGGPATALRGLAAAQAAQGDSVRVLSVNCSGPPWREVVRADKTSQVHEGVLYDYFPAAAPRRWLRSPALTAALPAAVSAAEIVEIHGLYHQPLIAAGRCCRRLGHPYLLRPLGILDPVIQRRRRWRKRLAGLLGGSRLLSGAAALHFTSAAEAAIARPWTGTLPGFVAPLGVAPHRPAGEAMRAACRSLWLGAGSGPLLLFLSRLAPKKGLGLLIAALPALLAAHPGLRLLVVGRDEGPAAALHAQATRLGLAERLIFTGHLAGEQKAAAFDLADLFVLPSLSENFGQVAVEAAAAGLPSVLSRAVAVAADLAAGGAALAVAPDSGALAAAIGELLAAPQRLAAMAAAGPPLAAARFGWPAAAARLATAYRDVLERQR